METVNQLILAKSVNIFRRKSSSEQTKQSYSTFKTDIIKMGLVFSISNFFIAKTSLANNWRNFCSSYLALVFKIISGILGVLAEFTFLGAFVHFKVSKANGKNLKL